MGILKALRQQQPDAVIAWATKQEFFEIVGLSGEVDQIFPLPKNSGLKGLFELVQTIKKWSPDVIYDAHQTPRTKLLVFMLRLLGCHFQFTKRSKERFKRFLLFQLRINKFPSPFRGMISYGKPLQQIGFLGQFWQKNIKHVWKFNQQDSLKTLDAVPDLYKRIALVPSAAWEMKRWPLSHWQQLVHLMPNQKFVVLGGPQDDFCQEIVKAGSPGQVINMAGKLNLAQSCYAVFASRLCVSADTGLIHVADVLGRPGICLLGPTAFGFTSSLGIEILQENLPCRPCSKDGRGRCHRAIYQECMVSITPNKVVMAIEQILIQNHV